MRISRGRGVGSASCLFWRPLSARLWIPAARAMATPRCLAALATLLPLLDGGRLSRPRATARARLGTVEARASQVSSGNETMWPKVWHVARRGIIPGALFLVGFGLDVDEGIPEPEEAFDLMDASGDGRLSWAEYNAFAERVAARFAHQGQAFERLMRYYSTLFDYADIDGDRHLSRKEFDFSENIAVRVGHDSILEPRGERHPDFDFPVVFSDEDFEVLVGLEHLSHVFSANDVDANGELSLFDFSVTVRESFLRWGWPESQILGAELKHLIDETFDAADANGDGTLGLREFQFATLLARAAATKKLSSVLMVDVDADGDGRLGFSEVAQAASNAKDIRTNGADADLLPGFAEMLHEHFVTGDADGDGSLDRKELDDVSARMLQWETEWKEARRPLHASTANRVDQTSGQDLL